MLSKYIMYGKWLQMNNSYIIYLNNLKKNLEIQSFNYLTT